MSLTFDDAIAMVGTYLTNNDLSNSDNNDRFFYTILNELRQEYAPTIKMTKNDKDILLYNIENYSFDVFAENISLSDKEKFGLPANKEFQGLSIKDLMRAWLNPNSIQIIDEK